jgi:hypothetical protein
MAGGTWFSRLELEGDEDGQPTSYEESGRDAAKHAAQDANEESEDETVACTDSDYYADDEAEAERSDPDVGTFLKVESVTARATAVRKAHATKTLGVALLEMPGDQRTESWLRHVQARSKDIKCTVIVRGRRIHSRLVWA